MVSRVVVMLPTYNEAENIGALLDALLALEPAVEALVVDDDSPDKTWLIVQQRMERSERLHLLYRTEERGRGTAGIAGLCQALRMGADFVLEMDADWSHDPRFIPGLIETAIREQADVVIGSRLVAGGGEHGRGRSRRWITHLANHYIRFMLGLRVRDCTSGFRLFSRRCLENLPWDVMHASGPEILQEILLAAHSRGFKLVETPISFYERRHGQSTFNGRIILRSLLAMWRLRFRPGELVGDRGVAGGDGAADGSGGGAVAWNEMEPIPVDPLTATAPQPPETPVAQSGPQQEANGEAMPGSRQQGAPPGVRRTRRQPKPGPNGLAGGWARLMERPGARILARPAGWLYGMGRVAHRAIRVHGPGGVQTLPAPVICVGNLTVGGTGKTPFVIMLARYLRQHGRRPVILSRGYGAVRRSDAPLVVSDGRRVLATAAEAGDEPRLMAEACEGAPVLIHADRLASGRGAMELFGPDLFILDDGFQHDGLARDLDIVLWDARDRPSRMRLLPVGRLREGLGALGRAGAVVLTHGELLAPDEREWATDRVVAELKRYAPGLAIFEAHTKLSGWRALGGPTRGETGTGAGPWRGRRVLLASALARPEGFEAMIRADGARVVHHFAYPDHYRYTESDLEGWRVRMEREGAEMVVTTAKDAVKLSEMERLDLAVVAVDVSMSMTQTDRWRVFLDSRLGARDREVDRREGASGAWG